MTQHEGAQHDATGETLVGVYLSRNPVDPCWELHPALRHGKAWALFGWRMSTPPLDAGVPHAVASILCQALSQCGKLTFLHSRAFETPRSPTWQSAPEGWTCVLEPKGMDWLRWRPVLPLLCTMEPTVAMQLFNAEPFSWTMRGQVVVLSRREAPPPLLSYHAVFEMLKGEAVNALRIEENATIRGLVSPGVDGDFVELGYVDETIAEDVETQLSQACAEAAVQWRIVSEAELKILTSAPSVDIAVSAR